MISLFKFILNMPRRAPLMLKKIEPFAELIEYTTVVGRPKVTIGIPRRYWMWLLVDVTWMGRKHDQWNYVVCT
jgi:hypothetical protein